MMLCRLQLSHRCVILGWKFIKIPGYEIIPGAESHFYSFNQMRMLLANGAHQKQPFI